MILPFILSAIVYIQGTIKSEYLTATKERLSLPHQNSGIPKIALNNEHHALLEMFPASFENLPNLSY
ncbi:unnamed protein product [Rhizophagus irregularis]|nr:unnamed protein product [Rhizophagus irregularis]